MTTYKLAIQCVDRLTGAIGCFLYDPCLPDKLAITPVFSDLAECYTYLRKSGYKAINPHSLVTEYTRVSPEEQP